MSINNKLPISITIPDCFLDAETRNGFYVSSEMKCVWAVEIDMLYKVSDICNKYGLKWYTDGGTTLGVVRHGGFIPWDDDIDLAMFRDDFERFIRFARQELQYPYFLQIQETDENCMHGHIQIRNSMTTGILKGELRRKYKYNQGIFIDIFPLDNISDDIEEGRNHALQHLEYKALANSLLCKCYTQVQFRKNLFVWLRSFIVNEYKIKKYKKEATYYYKKFQKGLIDYNTLETECVANCTIYYHDKLRWPREWFSNQVFLKFEWFELPVCEGYIEYLNQMFGNWQEFVMNSSCHGGVFFDTKRPYTEYLK